MLRNLAIYGQIVTPDRQEKAQKDREVISQDEVKHHVGRSDRWSNRRR